MIVRIMSTRRLHHFEISKKQRISIIGFINRKQKSIILTNIATILSINCYVLLNLHRSLPIGPSYGSPLVKGSRFLLLLIAIEIGTHCIKGSIANNN